MYKTEVFCWWNLPINFYHNKKTELYVPHGATGTPPETRPDDVVRFLWVVEPPTVVWLNDLVKIWNDENRIDYIFTFQEDLLEKMPNSHLLEFGTSWVENYQFPIKKFEVSTLVGSKLFLYTEGHKLRHDVWNSEGEIRNIPTMFFNSSANPNSLKNCDIKPKIYNDKSPLFDSQFHICIENSRLKNYFTEKIIDCFQTKTIPIYYGCSNIDQWFDTRGMFIVNNLEDIVNVCNSLTPETYNQMLPFIEENYERSKKFVTVHDRIEKLISDIMSKHDNLQGTI